MNIYFRYFREFSVAALIVFAPLETIAVCGRVVTGSHCDVIPFDVFAEIGSEFSAVIIEAYSDGHGSVRFDSSGLIQYAPSPLDAGDTVDVTVVYFLDQNTTQQYTCVTGIIVTNNRPTISCPDSTSVVRGSTAESARVSISDRDPCDAIFLKILEINPKPFGEVSINQRGPRIVFSADKRDAHRVDTDYEILIEVSDKIEADTCAMIFTVLHEAPICLRFTEEYSVFQYQVVRISVFRSEVIPITRLTTPGDDGRSPITLMILSIVRFEVAMLA